MSQMEANRFSGPGYEEIGTGTFVPDESAFDYALERCLHGPEQEEFKEELVSWFYSSMDWVHENGRKESI